MVSKGELDMSKKSKTAFDIHEQYASLQKLKKDAGKNRLDLLPINAIEAMGSVLTFGASKGYEEDSWRLVEPKRYRAALLRHFFAYMKGEHYDPESGLEHLAHCLCNIAFLLEIERKLDKPD